MTHGCHPTFQSLARAHFPAAMKRENVFISTCEIYLFPFAFTSHSFISPGKEHVSLKQTKHLIRGWLQSHCRSLQKLSLWNMPVWMWWKLKVLRFLLPFIWVAVLYTLIDEHDSVRFGFCPVSFRASHILSTPILFQSERRIIESPI